jgi:hypothetical protein
VEQEAAGPDEQVSAEGDLEDHVVSIFAAVEKAFESEPQEQQVGQGIDNFGEIDGRVVVLSHISLGSSPDLFIGQGTQTSSHQFKVEVTGLQYPDFNGGYGKKGS